MDNLVKLVEDLKIAVDGRKGDDVPSILDTVLSQIDSGEKELKNAGDLVTQLAALLEWENTDVVAKTAAVVAALAKSESGRSACCRQTVTTLLLRLLSSHTDNKLLIQACRALGNICYENSEGNKLVVEGDGLSAVLCVLRRAVSQPDEPHATQLRACSAGCLLNLLMGQDHLYPKALDLDIMELLCSVLELGVTKEGEEAAIHTMVILGLLTDAAPGTLTLSEKLCNITVKTLEASTSGELSELCVELLHTQAENESVRLHLAKAGLCELLVDLLEKHRPLVEDDETRNLLKMACDLIIIILNGDDSMNLLYSDGKGKVFQGMVNWLVSTDDDLQITGVLAMGNFARTDKHCLQMVDLGVSKKLLSLLKRNNVVSADIRLQHALLSALRNLVIPVQNKSIMLAEGLLDAVLPMVSIPTFPVVFKLLGTIRMVIDGQESAAVSVGRNAELVSKLVEWCTTEDHPGVQGEANRLLAWLIKNSRDRDVMGVMVQCGAVARLVAMITAEHAVMQTEALLALSLLTAMRMSDAEPSLVSCNVGQQIVSLVTSSQVQREVFQNVLALVGTMVTSGDMKRHLHDTGVAKALTSTVISSETFADLRDQVARLSSMIDSG
ncbi:GTPase-GDP dissociation stimulator vimar [Macrosteles quadrilineatus]|uniref:GTPase-GDP dissociation stimulator vimar n=1 Tax=Macrosteles quadrilineatus TaxID=74068 RepID=UPI0023E26A23|nr:GTPase-GDP dissociation stimulator vimar [Macrosteles quadrilineatus]